MSAEVTYNRMAKLYDLVFRSPLHNGRKKLAKLIHADGGTSILEIGVGTGLMLDLYPANSSITGVDVSEKMLDIARIRASLIHDKTIELIHQDGEHTSLKAASYDHVVLPYVYSVTEDPDHLINESFRLCKQGGTIWILNHFSGLSTFWDLIGWTVKRFPGSVGFRSEFSYAEYVGSKSWNVESIHKANFFGLSRIIKIKNVAPN